MRLPLLALIVALIPPAMAKDPPAAAALATAEFAFAAHSVATDMKQAFLAVMTEDAILFRPGPVNGREAFNKAPPPAIELNWRPAVVHVAASGDFGYSTGPARIQSKADPSKVSYTHFLSIWQKLDGVWKLKVDVGINHAEPHLADGWLELSAGSGTGPGEAAFAAAEKSFSALSESAGYGAALQEHADANIRVYRTPLKPFLGKTALVGQSFGAPGWVTEMLDRGVASSGDVAWSVVKLTPRGATAPAAHALRVWRARDGKFLLVADLLVEMPKGQ